MRTVIDAAIVGGAATATIVTQQTMILGIPAGILLAAYAGALFGVAYTKPEAWGSLIAIPPGTRMARIGWVLLRAGGLLFTMTMFAFLASWSVASLPHVPLAGWTGQLPPQPFAGLLAWGGQYLLPIALQSAGSWIKRKGEGP